MHRPQTTRPPKGGLSSIRVFAIKENLERAKGLEPSTPTLARSCSTTELHPHPRWRRTRAVNGRRMTNADRECNSPDAIRHHVDHPISLTKGSESVRNNVETGLAGHLGPSREPKLPATQREAGAIRAIFARASKTARVNSPHAQSQSKVPWLTWTGHRRSRRVPLPEGACRLNFTAKAPSSG